MIDYSVLAQKYNGKVDYSGLAKQNNGFPTGEPASVTQAFQAKISPFNPKAPNTKFVDPNAPASSIQPGTSPASHIFSGTKDALGNTFVKPEQKLLADAGTRIAQAGVSAAEPLMSPEMRQTVETNLQKPQHQLGVDVAPLGKGMEAAKQIGGQALNAVDAIGNAALGEQGVSKLAEKATQKITSMADKQALKEATDLVQPNMNKKLAINTLKNSGKATGGAEESGILGTVKAKPTTQINNIAEDVKGIVSKNNSPIKNITNLNDTINHISENEITPALKANKTLLNNQTVIERLKQIQPTRLIKGDESLNRTYNQVRELMVEKISENSNTAKGIDSHSLWQARKQFDAAVEDQFGDAVYNPEKNSAVKQAIRDVRTKVNDIVGEHNSTFKPQIKKLSNMYTARDTLAENNYKILTGQSNSLLRFAANHPVITKVAGTAAGLTAAGGIAKKFGVLP